MLIACFDLCLCAFLMSLSPVYISAFFLHVTKRHNTLSRWLLWHIRPPSVYECRKSPCQRTLLSSKTSLICFRLYMRFYDGRDGSLRRSIGYICSVFFPSNPTIVPAIQFETNNPYKNSESKLTLISLKYFVCIFVEDKRLIRLYSMLFIL